MQVPKRRRPEEARNIRDRARHSQRTCSRCVAQNLRLDRPEYRQMSQRHHHQTEQTKRHRQRRRNESGRFLEIEQRAKQFGQGPALGDNLQFN